MGLLGASDLGVLCSKSEGLPNAILEYMANGLPVVASDLPGNREALGDDPLQILPASGDADSLAERMLSFLQSPRLSRDVGERNRLRAEQEFSLKSMCEKSVAILNDLLAQSERRRAAA
ncbi:MAG: putative glycosyltransferase EpsD [candidate division BRC1 bacterium ADurb.BinA364]|nr:MAG: putative glycosyltransferase EpsD [candidate division BRC1 bacterium ADurb.BinA364]